MTLSERCEFVPPTPGFAPCKREAGHDGPCAHEEWGAPDDDLVMRWPTGEAVDWREALGDALDELRLPTARVLLAFERHVSDRKYLLEAENG